MSPTWDATWKGQPLTERAYKANLAILRRMQSGRGVCASVISAWHDECERSYGSFVADSAFGALSESGLITGYTPPRDYPDAPFVWTRYAITDKGRQYLAERKRP
jgi:hypothetical protein